MIYDAWRPWQFNIKKQPSSLSNQKNKSVLCSIITSAPTSNLFACLLIVYSHITTVSALTLSRLPKVGTRNWKSGLGKWMQHFYGSPTLLISFLFFVERKLVYWNPPMNRRLFCLSIFEQIPQSIINNLIKKTEIQREWTDGDTKSTINFSKDLIMVKRTYLKDENFYEGNILKCSLH